MPRKEQPSIPAGKMLRVFTCINLLATSALTINELAHRLDVDPRTAYRYIKLLQEIGFCIDMKFTHQYFICTNTWPEFINAIVKEAIKSNPK